MSLLTGKLPAELLARLLSRVVRRDPRVLLGPTLGEDAALIDLGDRVLVAKADPVTFATDRIGWYAVHVNANDVACMGARPAWFLATILLPQGAPEALAEEVFAQIEAACEALDVTLVGGHTEVTYGLERPIVAGAMLAEAVAGRIVRNEAARPGDHLILTKGIAIEGTALLARDAADELRRRGLGEASLERACALLDRPGISVVREALLACDTVPVHAMHDPTEGGLATALHEVAAASGLVAEVQEEAVTVLPETAELCRALGLDPLGLLASGSLLIAVTEEDCERVRGALSDAKISAACLGRLVEGKEGVIIDERGTRRDIPHFRRDELARFLESLGTRGARG
jgi:hydrogenase expression/formation protein HypE